MEIKVHIRKLAKSLVQEGVQYAFGLAGGGMSLELITALEEEGVRFFPVAHEASAAFMAGACCYDGKTRAVAISIKGPGFANLIPGILSNFYENRPAITISEAYSGKIPAFKKHKRLNHKIVYPEILKAFIESDDNPETIKNLVSLAEDEVPGPVHIELFGEPSEKQLVDSKAFAKKSENIEEVLKTIEEHNRPVIILGSLANRKIKLIKWEEIGVPILTTAAAKGSVNEKSNFAGGIITGEVKDLSPEKTVLEKADIIISFGLRNTEVIKPEKYNAFHINIDTNNFGLEKGHDPDINFVAGEDIENIALEVVSRVRNKKWGSEIIKENRNKLNKELYKNEWLPANVFKTIQEKIKDATLVLDTGLFCTIGETVWNAENPKNFVGSSVGRFMGASIPTAIGFAASTGRKVVSVAGDGGIRPYLPEIKLAVEEKLPILFVLMSDDRYGTISISGKKKELSEKAFKINNSSWSGVVEKMGCRAMLIGNKQELESALVGWSEGPVFLEMHFDPDLYREMTDNIR